MYTATITGKTISKENKQIILQVEFSDGENTIGKNFPFGFDISYDQMQMEIKRHAQGLDALVGKEAEVVAGPIDFATVKEDLFTTEERAFYAWFAEYQRLSQVQKLIELGVFTGTEKQITDLRAKVKADFKPAFISKL